jgi:two-component system, chemotaxis family, CheB/CheR fusion protein
VEELNIVVDVADAKQVINIVVEPFPEAPTSEALLAVYFERVTMIARDDNTQEASEGSTEEGHDQKHHLLLEELNDTRAYLQSTIEELKSSNEEMQSINEELQSLNEELETSQEELKAVNEELMTINAELEGKIEEVTWVRNDLSNTLNTLQTGIILLDDELLIRRFNPAATKGFKLIASDVGRSIGDIVSEFVYPSFLQDAEKVFESLVPYELDVQTRDGRWYALLIRPYRTLQNAIKGLVVSFNDITSRKQIEASHQKAQLLAENILTMVKQPFLILDAALYVLNANQAFSKLFDVSREDTVGKHLKRLGEGEWNASTLISLIEKVFQENTTIEDYEFAEEFPRIGRKTMLLNARQIQAQEQQPTMVLIALEDVTGSS